MKPRNLFRGFFVPSKEQKQAGGTGTIYLFSASSAGLIFIW